MTHICYFIKLFDLDRLGAGAIPAVDTYSKNPDFIASALNLCVNNLKVNSWSKRSVFKLTTSHRVDDVSSLDVI